jgi:putative two-component system response regulator
MNKVLIVDDEEKNLRLLEALLAPLSLDIILARDGKEALEKARSGHPDLILLDIQMPKLNGLEVVKILKNDKKTSIIPIVMVTAFNEVEDRVKALEAGADDFLSKPVEKTELRARVISSLKVKAYNDLMINYQKTLESEVNQRTAELQKAFKRIKSASLETIYRLSRAAEFRDEDTGAHIQRMSRYAAMVAKKMGFNESDVEDLLFAAPMHDVGKIGVPDHILLKPGKLNDDEWVIMRQHTNFGAKILEGSNEKIVQIGEMIAFSHHEKWDGSGYPNKLKGEEIPVFARISAIADVFDALTSDRPYRKEPFSIEQSLAMIKDGKGTHFDPAVVDAFLSIIEDVLKVKERLNSQKGNLNIQVIELEKIA